MVNLHWVAGLVDVPDMAAQLAGKRLVWTLHDQNPFTGGCHYAGDCRRFETGCGRCPQLGFDRDDDLATRQFRIKAEAYARLSLRLVAPSRWLADECAASALLGRFPATAIPYGVPTDVFGPSDTTGLRRSLGLAPDDFALFFGAHAHTARKGLRPLQDYLARLPATMVGRRLVAVAAGAPTDALPSAVPLIMRGYLADPRDMAGCFGLAGLHVMPSLMDNLPNTMLDSLTCGAPVAGFRVGGVPEGIVHGENGWLAAPGDVDGLLAATAWAAA